ncbi:MAG: alpha-hydroxy-acid oxidizing protein [Leucobacter sp.]|nr:alpha-hydroxy-acid oxidizing protein [Leucobacter sp.]
MARNLYSVDRARQVAERRLPRMVYDFLEGGALDERTLARNRAAFAEARFEQRVLVDLPEVRTETRVLDTEFAVPLAVSPMGLLTVLHPRADLAIASAAAEAGSVFVHSPWSGCSLEQVQEQAGSRLWAQIAFWSDRSVTDEHIARAKNLGVDTLVVAGDVSFTSKRERDLRHGTGMPPRPPFADVVNVALHPGWLWRLVTGPALTWGTYRIDGRRIRMGEMDHWMERHETHRASWTDLAELRARWDGRLVVKGVMGAANARAAVDAGADAVFVSNHGGRQFDGQPATLDVLPAIADAVGGRAAVVLDGGVRRGSDIAVALNHGADLVSAGRPFAYGLAAQGERGVQQVFAALADELVTAMGFLGAASIRDLTAQGSARDAVTGRNELGVAEGVHDVDRRVQGFARLPLLRDLDRG